jgi:hypothetical protein
VTIRTGQSFPEWSTLVVDSKRRDLLDELQEIHRAVQQGWGELSLEIYVGVTPIYLLVTRQLNVHGELTELVDRSILRYRSG